jgi:hypothetical protein
MLIRLGIWHTLTGNRVNTSRRSGETKSKKAIETKLVGDKSLRKFEATKFNTHHS